MNKQSHFTYLQAAMKCDEPLAPEPIDVCILMGKTGAGKSSFIRLLGGRDQAGNEPVVNAGIDSCEYTIYTLNVRLSALQVRNTLLYIPYKFLARDYCSSILLASMTL